MKKTEITVGGRIKFHVGPFEVEALVINDNLGVVMHAHTPKKETFELKNIGPSDNNLPFSKDLDTIWAEIKNHEQVKNLAEKFPISLKGLTIATTRFPLLYEKQKEFFQGKETRDVSLYTLTDNKAKIAGVQITKAAFFDSNVITVKSDSKNAEDSKIVEYELPTSLLDETSKPALKEYGLIPLRVKGSDSNFYPLYDYRWEIELDIEIVSHTQKKAVVLNPSYVKGKENYLKLEEAKFEKAQGSLMAWDYSELYNGLVAARDQKFVDYFSDKNSAVINRLKENLCTKIQADINRIKIEIEKLRTAHLTRHADIIKLQMKLDVIREELNNNLSYTLPLPVGSDKLETHILIADYFLPLLEKNGELDINELIKKTSREFTDVFLVAEEKYAAVKKEIEIKTKALKSKWEGEDREYLEKKKLIDVHAKAMLSMEEDLPADFTNYVNGGVSKYMKEFESNDLAVLLKKNKETQIKTWIQENKNQLSQNNTAPSLSDINNQTFRKVFKEVDALYLSMMTPKELANYEYERRNIHTKYIVVSTNELDGVNLFGMRVPGITEVQFKFKRTLSEQFRKKLTAVYNNDDVYASQLVALDKKIEEKQKAIDEKQKEIAAIQAKIDEQVGGVNVLRENNKFYKSLIVSGVNNLKELNKPQIINDPHFSKCSLFDHRFGSDLANFDSLYDFDLIKNYSAAVEGLLKIEIGDKDKEVAKNLTYIKTGIANVKKDDLIFQSDKDGKIEPLTKEIRALKIALEALEKEEKSLNVEKSIIDARKVKAEKAEKDHNRIVKLSDHPELALHPNWYDSGEKKLKFPTLQDRVLTALKQFGK